MKKTSHQALKVVCVFALIGIIVWIVFYCIQTYYVLTGGIGDGVINWGSPNMGVKLAMFWASRMLMLAIGVLLIAFVKNILKHLKGGAIFNRSNVVLLWVLAIVLPIHAFLSDNLHYAVSADVYTPPIVMTDTPFVYCIVTVLVAMLYKLACDAAEEQQLTI